MVDQDKDKKIGGVNYEVEIDESLFGSTKYGRGNPFRHRQCWVLGGKCRQTGKIFIDGLDSIMITFHHNNLINHTAMHQSISKHIFHFLKRRGVFGDMSRWTEKWRDIEGDNLEEG